MNPRGKFKTPAAKAGQHFKPPSTDTKSRKPEPKNWRVEATVPAIQWVEADTKEEAIRIACAHPADWGVDVNAPVGEEHVVDVEAEDE